MDIIRFRETIRITLKDNSNIKNNLNITKKKDFIQMKQKYKDISI